MRGGYPAVSNHIYKHGAHEWRATYRIFPSGFLKGQRPRPQKTFSCRKYGNEGALARAYAVHRYINHYGRTPESFEDDVLFSLTACCDNCFPMCDKTHARTCPGCSIPAEALHCTSNVNPNNSEKEKNGGGGGGGGGTEEGLKKKKNSNNNTSPSPSSNKSSPVSVHNGSDKINNDKYYDVRCYSNAYFHPFERNGGGGEGGGEEEFQQTKYRPVKYDDENIDTTTSTILPGYEEEEEEEEEEARRRGGGGGGGEGERETIEEKRIGGGGGIRIGRGGRKKAIITHKQTKVKTDKMEQGREYNNNNIKSFIHDNNSNKISYEYCSNIIKSEMRYYTDNHINNNNDGMSFVLPPSALPFLESKGEEREEDDSHMYSSSTRNNNTVNVVNNNHNRGYVYIHNTEQRRGGDRVPTINYYAEEEKGKRKIRKRKNMQNFVGEEKEGEVGEGDIYKIMMNNHTNSYNNVYACSSSYHPSSLLSSLPLASPPVSSPPRVCRRGGRGGRGRKSKMKKVRDNSCVNEAMLVGKEGYNGGYYNANERANVDLHSNSFVYVNNNNERFVLNNNSSNILCNNNNYVTFKEEEGLVCAPPPRSGGTREDLNENSYDRYSNGYEGNKKYISNNINSNNTNIMYNGREASGNFVFIDKMNGSEREDKRIKREQMTRVNEHDISTHLSINNTNDVISNNCNRSSSSSCISAAAPCEERRTDECKNIYYNYNDGRGRGRKIKEQEETGEKKVNIGGGKEKERMYGISPPLFSLNSCCTNQHKNDNEKVNDYFSSSVYKNNLNGKCEYSSVLAAPCNSPNMFYNDFSSNVSSSSPSSISLLYVNNSNNGNSSYPEGVYNNNNNKNNNNNNDSRTTDSSTSGYICEDKENMKYSYDGDYSGIMKNMKNENNNNNNNTYNNNNNSTFRMLDMNNSSNNDIHETDRHGYTHSRYPGLNYYDEHKTLVNKNAYSSHKNASIDGNTCDSNSLFHIYNNNNNNNSNNNHNIVYIDNYYTDVTINSIPSSYSSSIKSSPTHLPSSQPVVNGTNPFCKYKNDLNANYEKEEKELSSRYSQNNTNHLINTQICCEKTTCKQRAYSDGEKYNNNMNKEDNNNYNNNYNNNHYFDFDEKVSTRKEKQKKKEDGNKGDSNFSSSFSSSSPSSFSSIALSSLSLSPRLLNRAHPSSSSYSASIVSSPLPSLRLSTQSTQDSSSHTTPSSFSFSSSSCSDEKKKTYCYSLIDFERSAKLWCELYANAWVADIHYFSKCHNHNHTNDNHNNKSKRVLFPPSFPSSPRQGVSSYRTRNKMYNNSNSSSNNNNAYDDNNDDTLMMVLTALSARNHKDKNNKLNCDKSRRTGGANSPAFSTSKRSVRNGEERGEDMRWYYGKFKYNNNVYTTNNNNSNRMVTRRQKRNAMCLLPSLYAQDDIFDNNSHSRNNYDYLSSSCLTSSSASSIISSTSSSLCSLNSSAVFSSTDFSAAFSCASCEASNLSSCASCRSSISSTSSVFSSSSPSPSSSSSSSFSSSSSPSSSSPSSSCTGDIFSCSSTSPLLSSVSFCFSSLILPDSQQLDSSSSVSSSSSTTSCTCSSAGDSSACSSFSSSLSLSSHPPPERIGGEGKETWEEDQTPSSSLSSLFLKKENYASVNEKYYGKEEENANNNNNYSNSNDEHEVKEITLPPRHEDETGRISYSNYCTTSCSSDSHNENYDGDAEECEEDSDENNNNNNHNNNNNNNSKQYRGITPSSPPSPSSHSSNYPPPSCRYPPLPFFSNFNPCTRTFGAQKKVLRYASFLKKEINEEKEEKEQEKENVKLCSDFENDEEEEGEDEEDKEMVKKKEIKEEEKLCNGCYDISNDAAINTNTSLITPHSLLLPVTAPPSPSSFPLKSKLDTRGFSKDDCLPICKSEKEQDKTRKETQLYPQAFNKNGKNTHPNKRGGGKKTKKNYAEGKEEEKNLPYTTGAALQRQKDAYPESNLINFKDNLDVGKKEEKEKIEKEEEKGKEKEKKNVSGGDVLLDLSDFIYYPFDCNYSSYSYTTSPEEEEEESPEWEREIEKYHANYYRQNDYNHIIYPPTKRAKVFDDTKEEKNVVKSDRMQFGGKEDEEKRRNMFFTCGNVNRYCNEDSRPPVIRVKSNDTTFDDEIEAYVHNENYRGGEGTYTYLSRKDDEEKQMNRYALDDTKAEEEKEKEKEKEEQKKMNLIEWLKTSNGGFAREEEISNRKILQEKNNACTGSNNICNNNLCSNATIDNLLPSYYCYSNRQEKEKECIKQDEYNKIQEKKKNSNYRISQVTGKKEGFNYYNNDNVSAKIYANQFVKNNEYLNACLNWKDPPQSTEKIAEKQEKKDDEKNEGDAAYTKNGERNKQKEKNVQMLAEMSFKEGSIRGDYSNYMYYDYCKYINSRNDCNNTNNNSNNTNNNSNNNSNAQLYTYYYDNINKERTANNVNIRNNNNNNNNESSNNNCINVPIPLREDSSYICSPSSAISLLSSSYSSSSPACFFSSSSSSFSPSIKDTHFSVLPSRAMMNMKIVKEDREKEEKQDKEEKEKSKQEQLCEEASLQSSPSSFSSSCVNIPSSPSSLCSSIPPPLASFFFRPYSTSSHSSDSVCR